MPVNPVTNVSSALVDVTTKVFTTSGTVTSVAGGNGLTPGPITVSGTIGLVGLTSDWTAGAFNIFSKNSGARAFDVVAYGATLNGATDDTTAFTNALTAAAANFAPVYIPPSSGGMRIISNVTIPVGVSIIGEFGANNTTSSKIICDGLAAGLTYTSGGATNYFSFMQGIDIRRGATVPTGPLILLNNSWFVYFDQCYFQGGVGTPAIMRITGNTSNIAVWRSLFGGAPSTCLQIGNGGAGDSCNAIYLANNEFTGATAGAVVINALNSTTTLVTDVIEGNTGAGLRIEANATAGTENTVSIVGGYFEGNSTYDIDVNPSGTGGAGTHICSVNIKGGHFSGLGAGLAAFRVNAKMTEFTAEGFRSTNHVTAGAILGDLSISIGRGRIRGQFDDTTPISSTNPATTSDTIEWNLTPTTLTQVVGGTSANTEVLHGYSSGASGPRVAIENLHATSNNASYAWRARGSDKWRLTADTAASGSQAFAFVDAVNVNSPIIILGNATAGLVGIAGNVTPLTPLHVGGATSALNSQIQWSTGTAPVAVPGIIFTQTADSTTTANTLTTLFGTGVGTLTLPANALVAGRMVRVVIGGYTSTADGGAGTKTLAILLGGTTVATGTSGATITTLLNQEWMVECLIVCRTAGAPGTVQAGGRWYTQIAANGGSSGVFAASTATTNITTTGTLVVDVQFNNGNAVGAIKTTYAVVEILN